MNQIKNAIDGGILFVCVANSARSQIAEGLARKVFGPSVHVQSAGSRPARVHAHAIEVMNEVGVNISEQKAKSFNDIDMSRVGLVVSLCVHEVCPCFSTPSVRLNWFLPNPAICCDDKADIKSFRKTRDELVKKIDALREEYLHTPAIVNAREPELILHNNVSFFDPFRRFAFLRGLRAS